MGVLVYAQAYVIGVENMLLIVVLSALAAIVVGSRVRIPTRANTAKLGWMSQQWLTEYRASHLK